MRHRAERRPWNRSRTLVAAAVVVLGVAAVVVSIVLADEDPGGTVTAVPSEEPDSTETTVSASPSLGERTTKAPSDDTAPPGSASGQARTPDPTVEPPSPSPTPTSTSSTDSPPTDSAAPQTRIVDGPADGDNQASFAFAANEPVTYQCSLDGAAYSTCGSSSTYRGLKPGRHTLAVRSVDEAGNVDPSPAEWTWRASKSPRD
jgi:large repetitive protein